MVIIYVLAYFGLVCLFCLVNYSFHMYDNDDEE